jgi:uncharacterized protein (DUF697 family)
MSKKKLPKAVTQTADDMRKAADPAAPEASVSLTNATPETPAAAAVAPTSRRHADAIAIVERHANMSVLGGAIPIPLLNVAGVTAIILRMVKSLCRLYGVPYEGGRARALVVGLAGGAVPTTASAVTASTLVLFVPGANMIGLAVSSVTASVCTRAIGRRFVEHFEKGASLLDFPVVERRKPAAKNGATA